MSERTAASRLRLVPSAVTPLSATDLLAGAVAHGRDSGRAAFRREIRSYLGGVAAGTYTSFRRALAACLLELARAGEGDTVLVPSFCSGDYPAAIEGVGLDLARYDVDPEHLAAPPAAVDDLGDDVLAVVVVNVLGFSSPMEAIAERCERQDTYLVEALGYGLGAEYEGERLGTFGDCSVLNFQQGKPIPVGGGMVVSRREHLHFGDADREAVDPNAAMLGGYALCAHPPIYGLYREFVRPALERYAGADRISTHPESKLAVGYDPPFRTMSNFQGAVGRRVFERLPEHRRQRAAAAAQYDEVVAEIPGLTRIEPIDGLARHQWVRYPLLVESRARRDRLRQELVATGLEASVLYDWPPIDPDRHPGGARLQRELLALPTHPYVEPADRERVVGCLRAFGVRPEP